jgi:hypothetical protein
MARCQVGSVACTPEAPRAITIESSSIRLDAPGFGPCCTWAFYRPGGNPVIREFNPTGSRGENQESRRDPLRSEAPRDSQRNRSLRNG